MALEKEPETHLLQGLHRRELEKSASLQCLGGISFRFILSQLTKEEVKDRASPVAPVKNQVTGNEEFLNSRIALCSRGTSCAFKHDDRRQGKEKRRQATPDTKSDY